MLYLFIGTSGSGKTTLANKIFGEDKALVSVTTRPKREGEIEGKDYYFVSPEEFDIMEREHEIVERTEYAGHMYGLTQKEIESKVLFDDYYVIVDFNGAQQLNNILTYLDIPFQLVYLKADYGTIKERIKRRGDTPDSISSRLEQYYIDLKNNMPLENDYDTIILDANQELDDVIKEFYYKKGDVVE